MRLLRNLGGGFPESLLRHRFQRASRGLHGPIFRSVCCLAFLLSLGMTPDRKVTWDDVLRVTDNIVCNCGCPPTVVSACSCGRAGEMNREVQSLLEQGKSDEEIYDYYVAQFGPSILAFPKAEGFNLVGWILPFVALGIGALVVVAAYHQLKAKAGSDPSKTVARNPLQPEVQQRIRRTLADLD